ncbi:MAG TPA: hypothetical protein PKE59_00300 [Novosphingobium sp.]|jgi:hypothetical protein|nr:hypothetical protein [Novosphingobium sp.]
MIARLEPDGQRFVLDGVSWSGVYPVSELPAQLRFYRGLRDRKGGAYAAFYQPTVASLEALAREIKARA